MAGLTSSKLINRLFLSLWKKRYRDFVFLLLVFLFLLGIQYLNSGTVSPSADFQGNALGNSVSTIHVPGQPGSEQMVEVKRVVDGDTFIYQRDGEDVKVRLLGVDTPETVDPRKTVQCFGKEASDMTKNLLNGQTVRLLTDNAGDSKDKYGRELRYVYLQDGTMVNSFLLKNGFAHATPEYSFTYKEDFVNLENQARISQKGLWNPSACN